MLRWENLERQVEKDRQNQLRRERVDKIRKEIGIQNRKKKREEEKRLARRRKNIESRRWVSPQLALKTWEFRTQTLVDLINKFSEEFKKESDQMRRKYASYTFDVYASRNFLSSVFGEKIIIDHVSPYNFDFFHDKGQECWVATLNGKPLDIYEIISPKNSELFDCNSFYKYEEPDKLSEIVCKILIPGIAAYEIENKTSPLIKEIERFFKISPLLRELPLKHYSYSCQYLDESQTEEDYCTDLYLNNLSYRIINPTNLEEIKEMMLPSISSIKGISRPIQKEGKHC